jgi:hypothetical protein
VQYKSFSIRGPTAAASAPAKSTGGGGCACNRR